MKKKMILPALLSLFVSFAAIAQDQHQTEPQKENREEHRKERLEQLKTDLELSDEQVEKIKALMAEKHEKMQTVKENRPNEEMSEDEKKQARLEMMKARKDIQDEHQAKMKEILNETQFEKYLAIKAEHKGKRLKHKKHEEMHMHPHREGDHTHPHKHQKGEPHKH
ncbi:MAG: hypothetical protein CMC96_10360 [Flavobacteriales bacterium]|nr:hypothetical protein [Flavobacteriales bacterium]|tara:strand:+ start:104855 stop:105352 length:498 start_codon:yes stop_codon:yes gene_type:complete